VNELEREEKKTQRTEKVYAERERERERKGTG